MNKRVTIISSFMLSLSFIFFDVSMVRAEAPSFAGGLDQLMSDPAFQQEMERMTKELESNPALQAEVNKLLDDPEFMREMNQMLEDPAFQEELAKELQNMPVPPVQGAPVQPYQPVPSKPAEPVKKEEPKKISRDMIATIDEINVRLENFMQKTAQYTDMASNFEKWSKKQRIQRAGGMTWDAFRANIEKLKKTLYEIKAVDVKTQKPKYLADLSADEALCNNLTKFKSDLALPDHEPAIQVKLSKKVSPESKKAIVNVINDCLSALSMLKIQDELEKIIVKYDPVAKKLKEEEERKEKMAVTSGQRRQSQPAPMKAGMRGAPGAQGYWQEGIPGEQRGRPSFGPSPYGPGSTQKPFGEPGKQPSLKPESGAGKKPEEKKEAKKPEQTKKEEPKMSPGEEALEKLLNDVQDKLDECVVTIGDKLIDVKVATCVEKKGCADFRRELSSLTSSIKTLDKTVGIKVSQLIHEQKDPIKSGYIKSFKELWKQYSKDFQNLTVKLTNLRGDADLQELVTDYASALGSLTSKFAGLDKKSKFFRKRKPVGTKRIS